MLLRNSIKLFKSCKIKSHGLIRKYTILDREKTNNFNAWKILQEKLLKETNIQLIRGDCLNPTKSISFTPSKNQTNRPFTFPKFESTSEIINIGIRDSLDKLFNIFKNLNYKLVIPNDVYPVYNQIAHNNNFQYTEYVSTNKSINEILNNNSNKKTCILMTIPHVPTGKKLDTTDTKNIINWLNKDKTRLIIIDSVYAYKLSSYQDHFSSLLKTGQVIICYSLSKSFLLPLHYGIIYLPKNLSYLENSIKINKPSKEILNKVNETLKTHQELPEYQINLFKLRWQKLKPLLTSIYPKWLEPENGYLSTLPIHYMDLLKNNILAVPSHINTFNPTDLNISPYSIISCLYDNNHERKKYHVTRISNFSKAFDKYTRIYDKSKISESKFKDKFFILTKDNIDIGINKTIESLNKNNQTNDKICILETNIPYDQTIYNINGKNKGQYIKNNLISIDNIYEIDISDYISYYVHNSGEIYHKNYDDYSSFDNYNNYWIKTEVENIYAQSMKINNKDLIPYDKLKTRTISILPIAKGCQAKCPFCFSHSSISTDQKQSGLNLETVEQILILAKEKGAERAVITGGGEPMMLSFNKLKEMIKLCSKHYPKVVLITNGYALARLEKSERLERLLELENNGLSVLSISRHGMTSENNTQIMYLNTQSENISETYIENRNKFNSLKLRWVCVLQKGGVHDETTLEKYINWVINTGINEICFKELYVASSHESVYYNEKTNIWSRDNQVSLSLIINYIKKYNGKQISELPWQSPIYELDRFGHKLVIAAYTEPSVHWERTSGLCRSWNILSDGKCYASLEDSNSLLF